MVLDGDLNIVVGVLASQERLESLVDIADEAAWGITLCIYNAALSA